MFTTRVFTIGDSQAFRIPRELRTDQTEFYIDRVGRALILTPTDDPWYNVDPTVPTAVPGASKGISDIET